MGPNFDLAKIIDFFVGLAEVADGTTLQTTAECALSPKFDNVLAIAYFDTPAANNTLGIHGATSSGGSFSLLGTVIAAGVTNNLVVKEIKNCQHGWVKGVATRGTSTTLGFLILIPYSSKSGAMAPASDWKTNASYSMQVAPTAA